jgi:hypothetical protein
MSVTGQQISGFINKATDLMAVPKLKKHVEQAIENNPELKSL